MARSFLPGAPGNRPKRFVDRDIFRDSFLPGQARDAYAPGKNPASHGKLGQGTPEQRRENLVGYWATSARGSREGLGHTNAAGNTAAYKRAVRELQKLGAHEEVAKLQKDAYAPGKNPASHKPGVGRSSTTPPGSTPHQAEAHSHLHAAGYSHTSTSGAGTHHYEIAHPHGKYGVKVEKSGRFQGFSPTGMQGGGHKSELKKFLGS